MKTFVLAALAALSLGLGAANAATLHSHSTPASGSQYNWMAGGGG